MSKGSIQGSDLFSVGGRTVRQWRGGEVVKTWSTDDSRMLGADDIRVYGDRDLVLITASHEGGVTLVEWSTGRQILTKAVGNCHSALLRADGHVLAAASDRHDYVELIDVDGKTLDRCNFTSAHGLAWTSPAETGFWVTGTDQLWCVDIEENRLVPSRKITLPDGYAHDLIVAPDQKSLWVTTKDHIYVVCPATGETHPHPMLGNLGNVKCVLTEASGALSVVQAIAEEGTWWNHHLTRVIDSNGQMEAWMEVPDKLYKVRRADQLLHLRA